MDIEPFDHSATQRLNGSRILDGVILDSLSECGGSVAIGHESQRRPT